ncbi:hypothetical protein SAMN00808754_1040 [Thermanaeromonas toyohensis ToBE]|uniref:Uncharacterized protein n=1 Tax=Thermanaeromonas toyohensis ToBE TaxID=698762 RepID=A0A1W1VMB7_9FIRM|nr:hypothetical protein [Thermanaeromonas toyohensis]SMB94466.1 hypothetical protein SAMN00808754_1040 [Thermanaeromonas toyohensis ToBE]
MAKKGKFAPIPKIAKVQVTGRLDSLTDLLKLRLFEYSPQSTEELVAAAQKKLLSGQSTAKVQKNVNRCLSRNPCFRHEGRGLWCLRLDGLKENDAAHRLLQSKGEALRLDEINRYLRDTGQPEVQGEQKLVHDGRFIRLKDGRWGLIHWSYVEPSEEAKGVEAPTTTSPVSPEPIYPLAKPPDEPQIEKEGDFWDKLFPLPPYENGKATSFASDFASEEVAAGAEVATLTLIEGGKAGRGTTSPQENEEVIALRQEVEELRRENKNLLADLEKLHQRKEELRQELTQVEEQLVNLRVERDALKKRVSHLETRLMQLQGTLNKAVADAQAEQAKLKQQLREQEYRLQTTLIANEDLERAVAELQREKQELKRQLSLWPVRLALKFSSFLGLTYSRQKVGLRPLNR